MNTKRTPLVLVLVLLLVLAFLLGRYTAPGSSALSAGASSSTAGRTSGLSADGTSEAAAGQGTTVVPAASSGIAAAHALDPEITIDSLMATVAKEPPGLARFALLHAALQRITAENWHAAMVTMWKARAEGLINDEEMRYVLQRLGEAAGPAALEGFKPKDPVNAWETHSGRFAMMGWAMADPAAAKAWLETQPAGRYHDGMLWGYTLGLGLRDAPAALQAMQTLAPEEQARLLGNTLNGPGGARYQALAEAWLNANLPTGADSGKFREGPPDPLNGVVDNYLSAQIATFTNEKKNDKFFAWADRLSEQPAALFAPPNIARIAAEFVRRDDPAAGLAWIERFTAAQPTAGQPAIQGIIAQWTWRDPVAAANWLNQNAASPSYDTAVLGFLNAQRNRLDPETRQAWANTIHNPQTRDSALSKPPGALLDRVIK